MNIKKHYHIDNTLQRSVVEHNGIVLRRIARWVSPAGELAAAPEPAVWQECAPSGDYHNATSDISRAYERLFIVALINANAPTPPSGSRYFVTENKDRVYRFPAGGRGTAWFPNTETHRESGTPDFWSLDEMTSASNPEITFALARLIVPHIPA